MKSVKLFSKKKHLFYKWNKCTEKKSRMRPIKYNRLIEFSDLVSSDKKSDKSSTYNDKRYCILFIYNVLLSI